MGVMEGPRCPVCGAPLSYVGMLCTQCGANKARLAPGPTNIGSSAAPARPEPWLGFRHPRARGRTLLIVMAFLAALFVAGTVLAFIFY